MYQHIILARILFSVGASCLIFSLVFGWVSFSVPDWLQFYERNKLLDNKLSNENFDLLKKFGLWYKCIFSTDSNDFICTVWNNDAPSFVRVAQVLVPFGLILGCLSLLSTCVGFMCRGALISIMIFSALFAFLSFIFITIGATVFATESLVYVERLRLNNNENPRRWGMWLLVPNLILSFLTSLCFITASLLNWCDYRNMEVTGILSHNVDKYNGSVYKAPSESNTTSVIKAQYPHQDYPNTCYQISGLNNNNNNQQNPMGYPPPPSYAALVNPSYQPTPPGLFGYSRSGSPTMNLMHQHTNFDPYYPRHYMTETLEMDDLSRTNRSSRRRPRIRRQSSHRSRSNSPDESTIIDDNNQKQTQFIPIPIPYYQPQQTASTSQTTKLQTPMISSNNNPSSISYIVPQSKQQYMEETVQPNTKVTNMLKYGTVQPSLMVSNPSQPVYTIAYRTNNGGNLLAPNIITGPAAATYVTATRKQISEITSLISDSDKEEDRNYQTIPKQRNSKKININEAWTWRKL
ncbi:unnamed protein product [Rotaria sordida]|uniref:Uncharacterized protein n=1 Tax=Rotaria sordida TaxID=392033 RepID=A0A814LEM4_9BILA|nr:unnamed protein product [Rotaria sordida]